MYIDKDQAHKDQLKEYDKELDRYKDIRCNKNNNISIGSGNDIKYINASYIGVVFRSNYFITTQAPKPNTIEDFWTMVFQEKTKVVVMLCNFLEGGKKKCANYLDPENKMKNIELKEIKKREEYEEYDIRTLELKKLNDTRTRTITHIHYKKWPDKGVPEISSFETFLKIINIVIEKQKENEKEDEKEKEKEDEKEKENEKKDENKEFHPIVVHCSAGVGRTGTFISMFCLYKEIKLAQIDEKENNSIHFNIFNLVRKMKEMRLYMVQAFEQYKFVYRFAEFLLDKYNK